MVPQTETKAGAGLKAGVTNSRLTYSINNLFFTRSNLRNTIANALCKLGTPTYVLNEDILYLRVSKIKSGGFGPPQKTHYIRSVKTLAGKYIGPVGFEKRLTSAITEVLSLFEEVAKNLSQAADTFREPANTPLVQPLLSALQPNRNQIITNLNSAIAKLETSKTEIDYSLVALEGFATTAEEKKTSKKN